VGKKGNGKGENYYIVLITNLLTVQFDKCTLICDFWLTN